MEFAEVETRRRGYDEIRLYTHEKMTENIAMYVISVGRKPDVASNRVTAASSSASGLLEQQQRVTMPLKVTGLSFVSSQDLHRAPAAIGRRRPCAAG